MMLDVTRRDIEVSTSQVGMDKTLFLEGKRSSSHLYTVVPFIDVQVEE